ncbi:hypothetical protein HY636_01555 [Candidatus Woesearchaeota archaeon]|nr:hypothetical protein [Candidatus Woesearchaeota archaeon]
MDFKKMFSALFVILVTLVTIAGASAKEVAPGQLPVSVEIKFDGDLLDAGNVVNDINKNADYEVEVKVVAMHDPAELDLTKLTTLKDLSVEAEINGYNHNGQVYAIDFETIGDLAQDHSEKVTLNLNLPYKLDEGEYSLTVRVSDKLNDFTKKYILYIEPQENSMIIKDVVFSPSSTVLAGKSLLATIYMKNIGNNDETDGLKVNVNIPALGVSATDYVDSLDENEATSSEELWLVVPKCTPQGEYDAVVSVGFKDGDKEVSSTQTITVLSDVNDKSCQGTAQTQKTIIAVASEPQDVVQGEGVAIFPLTMTNAGTESKTYVVEVDGYQDWAKVSMSPSSVVVVQPSEAKAVYAYVSALGTASLGEHMFSVTVKSNGETLKQIPLKANVVASQTTTQPASTSGKWDGVKKGLEVGLIVLIVLLVILGLIIGFNKLKGSDEDDLDEEDKNYY